MAKKRKKSKGKSQSKRPARPPMPPPEDRDSQAVVFTPNPLEIFWEKYHNYVYLGIALVVVIWGGVYVGKLIRAKKNNLRWEKVYRETGIHSKDSYSFVGGSLYDRLAKADPVQEKALIEENKGTPVEPYLRYLRGRTLSLKNRDSQAKSELASLEKLFSSSELVTQPLNYAFFDKPLTPVKAVLEEMKQNELARKKYPFLFHNPEPDPSVTAVLQTNRGVIKIRFYPAKAPKHVKNFLRLAKAGFYDGQKIFKVSRGGNSYTPIFLEFGDVRTRDPKSKPEEWGNLDEKEPLPLESRRLFHFKGAVTAPNVSGGEGTSAKLVQVLGGDFHTWDGQNQVFGQVVEGLDLVTELAKGLELRNPTAFEGVPVQPPVIQKVTLKGDLTKILGKEAASKPATKPSSGPGKGKKGK